MQSNTPARAVPPDVCPLCYEIGKTPTFLVIFFSGIKIGALWNRGDPDPPNIYHLAHNTAACTWTSLIETFDAEYRTFPGIAFLELWNAAVGPAFLGTRFHECLSWFPNTIINPATSRYYGGFGIVIPPLEGGAWSLPEIMALLSEDPDWAQYLKARPTEANSVFYNLYKGNSLVNIKIKIDHS